MVDCIKVTLVNRVPNSVTVSTVVSGGGTWGTISGTITDQSDLVAYVADEIAEIPTPATPTLDSVTTQGATTTNNIEVLNDFYVVATDQTEEAFRIGREAVCNKKRCLTSDDFMRNQFNIEV